MDITPIIPEGRKIITSYGNEGFTISHEHYTNSILLLPQKVVTWEAATWNSTAFINLNLLLAQEEPIEILLIGGGEQHLHLTLEERQRLKQNNIALDTMSTGAACRTYNVLLAEGRKVGAALIMFGQNKHP